MIDITAYANGFGVVLVPFLVGIIIKAVMYTLNVGSRKHHFSIIAGLIAVSIYSPPVQAGTITGTIDKIISQGSALGIVLDGTSLTADKQNYESLLYQAFRDSREIKVDYQDSDFSIITFEISDKTSFFDKSNSLLIGAFGCVSFILGMSLKF